MLPKDVPAVRTARTAVEECLTGMPVQLRDDARSVVTELVANAVRHGEPPIRVTIERQAHGVRIDVSDAGAHRPLYSPRGPDTGWGLRIVDALAVAWNIADNASRVWCVLEWPGPRA
jgi:anti-sigma regulatory factor (Ser/Thr protein kinase)